MNLFAWAGFKGGGGGDQGGRPGASIKFKFFLTAKSVQVIVAGNRSCDRQFAFSGRVGVSSSAGCRAGWGCTYVFVVAIRNNNKKKLSEQISVINIIFCLKEIAIQPKFVVIERCLHILIAPAPPQL
jgi:hypothetical protein